VTAGTLKDCFRVTSCHTIHMYALFLRTLHNDCNIHVMKRERPVREMTQESPGGDEHNRLECLRQSWGSSGVTGGKTELAETHVYDRQTPFINIISRYRSKSIATGGHKYVFSHPVSNPSLIVCL